MIRPTVTIDERALRRYLAALDRNRGKPLAQRTERAINAASKLLLPSIRAEIPASGRPARMTKKGKPIRPMRRSAGTKLLKKQGGELIRPTWIGVKHYAFGWLTAGTRGHSLATRNVLPGQLGRTTRTGIWRSAFAHFLDGEVRPLAGIRVRGMTPRDIIGHAWDSHGDEIVALIARDAFEVKQ